MLSARLAISWLTACSWCVLYALVVVPADPIGRHRIAFAGNARFLLALFLQQRNYAPACMPGPNSINDSQFSLQRIWRQNTLDSVSWNKQFLTRSSDRFVRNIVQRFSFSGVGVNVPGKRVDDIRLEIPFEDKLQKLLGVCFLVSKETRRDRDSFPGCVWTIRVAVRIFVGI